MKGISIDLKQINNKKSINEHTGNKKFKKKCPKSTPPYDLGNIFCDLDAL